MSITAEFESDSGRAPEVSLKSKLRRAERQRQLKGLGLVAPLLTFLLVIFVLPIVAILFFAVSSPEVGEALPRTAEAIKSWDGKDLPDEATYRALAEDLAEGYEAKTVAGAGTRLNYQASGFRSLIMRTARKADEMQAPFKAAMIDRDERWGEIQYWRELQRAARPLTPLYVLQVLDLKQDETGAIVSVPENRAIYLDYLTRSLWISASVTVLCLLIGYPIAYFAAHTTSNWGYLVLGAVLLPFWISVLVRTAAWMVVLQREGMLNDLLIGIGLIGEPLQLLFNRFAVYIAMIHVLLPFLVMPLYNNMRTIPQLHLKAAGSLGATPFWAFWTVYFPQSLPGLSAGALLVFILALGYYITPALVGGPGDQMLSFLVTQFALEIGNWGMAAAAAGLLLVATLVSYAVFRLCLGARGFM